MTDKQNNFVKDINVPSKERIICHGVNVICENCGKQFKTDVRTGEREVWRKLGRKANRYRKALEEIEEYINSQGINHKWNMYIQRFRSGILDIINKAKDGNNAR